MTQTAVPTPPPVVTATPDALVHLRTAGVGLLIDLRAGNLPAVLHWGGDLGPLHPDDAAALALGGVEVIASNAADVPLRVALLPEPHTAWIGRPGLSGSRAGADWAPRFVTTDARLVPLDGDELPVGGDYTEHLGAARLVVDAADAAAELRLRLELELTGAGLVRARASVINEGEPYQLDDLTLCFPVPARAREVLDFAGRWGRERVPQRRLLTVGTHERENRRGRTGPDGATILSVGTPGFGFSDGEIWGLHVGFSGNHRHFVERQSTGRHVLGGGELLLPGEVQLGWGERYETPWIYAVHSVGLDQQAHRFHRFLRDRPEHPRSPRPVTLNTWEAVFFDHSPQRLIELADRASALGIERFVLDDGWFRGRRSDAAGLGDWYVDETVWPDGLWPLVRHVRGLGMEFGLWVEPEMINVDSDAARDHPEWIMHTDRGLPVAARNQHVIDLANPDVYAYLLDRLSAVIGEYDITYVKWDQNRDLVDAGTGPRRLPGVRAQTLATYRLMAELRQRFPALEIEDCASGGARVDLGILRHTDRVWVSDCNDPLERQSMNRWTGQLVPPEMLGMHVASPRSKATRRLHDLSFRAATAIFGHFGVEWDLTSAPESELAELAGWIGLYKHWRELLHSGDVVRMDNPDPSFWVSGVVAADRSRAVFALTFLSRSDVAPLGTFTLRGLDPDRRYRVRPLAVGDPFQGYAAPAWFAGLPAGPAPEAERVLPLPVRLPDWAEAPGVVLPGRVLATAGLQMPTSYPEQAVLLRVEAVD
ncbi:alpha-galactosidase [Dactylosporangium siamense]|uniref:alpha-galactosidase n=1 Tax=Dactylosporangium siamense TaxID=685454 RepID=A0A919UEV7_9ACTN|nr:alpha-galactosidase [Dactylosporangium siamense]GIG48013.1 alpha-galactosidase [Dactylosporangium siamense]